MDSEHVLSGTIPNAIATRIFNPASSVLNFRTIHSVHSANYLFWRVMSMDNIRSLYTLKKRTRDALRTQLAMQYIAFNPNGSAAIEAFIPLNDYQNPCDLFLRGLWYRLHRVDVMQLAQDTKSLDCDYSFMIRHVDGMLRWWGPHDEVYNVLPNDNPCVDFNWLDNFPTITANRSYLWDSTALSFNPSLFKKVFALLLPNAKTLYFSLNADQCRITCTYTAGYEVSVYLVKQIFTDGDN